MLLPTSDFGVIPANHLSYPEVIPEVMVPRNVVDSALEVN